MAVWCAQHREGWCACKWSRRPAEGADNVPTKCDHFVALPFGFARRTPDCAMCHQVLRENERAKRAS